MKQIVLAFGLGFAALGAHAQETAPPAADTEQGLSLIERGTQQLLRGMINDLDPLFEELGELAQDLGPKMQQFIVKMGPKFAGLLDQLDDLNYYSAPEILPNGDIIMRRKPSAPLYNPPETEVEL